MIIRIHILKPQARKHTDNMAWGCNSLLRDTLRISQRFKGSSNNPVQFFAFAMFVNNIVYNNLKYDSLDKVFERHIQVSKLLFSLSFLNLENFGDIHISNL